MALQALRSGASAGFLKFLLFGLLVLAVGGLVMTDVGGFFRGGVSGSRDIAKAGRQPIPLAGFDRTVRRSLAGVNLDPAMAYRLGYIDQLLNNELRAALLHQAADKTGIHIPEQRVAMHIRDMIAPMVPEGSNPQDIFQQLLLNQGLSEADLVRAMRRDISNNLMANSIRSGFAVTSAPITNDLYAFQHEKRDIRYVLFRHDESKNTAEPDEGALQGFYEALKESFAVPEKRIYQVIKLNTANLEKTIDIGEADLQEFYDSNIDQYNSPESRTLDQALLDKEEDARAVATLVKDGKTGLKDAVKKQTGNHNAYLGTRKDGMEKFPEELKPALKDINHIGQVIGPVKTGLGWYVMVVQSMERAHQKTFEQAKADIRRELLETKLIDQKYALAAAIDDAIAGGAGIDDLKKQHDLSITTLAQSNAAGFTGKNEDVFAAYAGAREQIAAAAQELDEGETTPMIDLADGGFIAIRLQTLTPKTYRDFADVREELRRRWVKDQQAANNRLAVMAILDAMKDKENAFEDYAKTTDKTVQSLKNLTRADAPQDPFDAGAVTAVFQAAQSMPFLIETPKGLAIAHIERVALPDMDKVAEKDLQVYRSNLLAETQNEALMVYLETLREKLGAYVNRPLLEAVYGNADAQQ